ncbi:MAG: response regulator [Clostridiales Family XIII bacterium]|jgi:signal transduction histidine kinase/CheY-like chemotaxis protein/HAMP domain-containing protein|nr:response regulator [Clostridiales Family XIII bacterium]
MSKEGIFHRANRSVSGMLDGWLNKMGMGMRAKLIIIFLIVKVIPLILLLAIAWYQIVSMGHLLSQIAVDDARAALNDSAVKDIERLSTDTAQEVANFLYDRDDDLLYLAEITPSEEAYRAFIETKTGRVIDQGTWALAEDGMSWVQTTEQIEPPEITSSNAENEERDGFHYRKPDEFVYKDVPIYDEIAFIDLAGNEVIKVVAADSTKTNFPLSEEKVNVADPQNTYVKSETYFAAVQQMQPGEIYVSDVTGAYVRSHFIGMYTPKQMAIGAVNSVVTALGKMDQTDEVESLTKKLTEIKTEKIPAFPHDAAAREEQLMQDVIDRTVPLLQEAASGLTDEALIAQMDTLTAKVQSLTFTPEAEAYAGRENPNGQRFEGIIRYATPVADESGSVIGYVTFAVNHDHIMEFVDHITPMEERYIETPSAYEGNYAFIWDYQCRSICHPRHHSIVGFNEETGEPQVPWLESSIYDAWQASGLSYSEFIGTVPTFDDQSREKTPAAALTAQGLVGLDGRYLNNAPQCTGWMDLTQDGGSGSFYILWSGLYKLNTAAAIPYYTGQYGDSARGFGFVAIGSGIEDFTRPADETAVRLDQAITDNLWSTVLQLLFTTIVIIIIVVFIAIWLASFLTNNIQALIAGISRFRRGEWQFRFKAKVKDEFGTLADSFDDMADTIVESEQSPLVITDMDMHVIYKNEGALALVDEVLDDSVGQNYFEHSIYPIDTEYDPLLALKEGREAKVYYYAHKGKYLKGQAQYLTDVNGEKSGYYIKTIDLTEMVQKQLALEEAVEVANRASEYKGEFLARMSHEIRTPMNAIIGITNIVQKKLDDLDEAAREQSIYADMEKIESSSQHLLGLLNDILEISKIEAGKIELSEEPMDLPHLQSTVVDIIKTRCEEKHIRLTTDFDTFSPATFLCDPLRLRQVLINLLGNAVKFTGEMGEVVFAVKNLGREEGRTHILFSVRDNGIGISEENIAAIFEPFEQADRKVTKLYGGTGLGLAISQHIVQLFGGQLSVSSTLGEGSDFRFDIWLTETAEDEAARVKISDPTGRFTGKRALLADDVEINRLIVSSLLEGTGLEIVEAADGSEALETFAASEEGGFDIIFMDIQMPEMDGYEAARAMRAMARPDAKRVPIIAFSANAFKEDIDRAKASGMNGHIAKPVEYETLVEALFKYLT